MGDNILDDGDLVLPCDPLFNNLVVRACQPASHLAIRDVNLGVEKTYAQLLSHAVQLRNRLRGKLSQETLQELRNGHEVYITLLAPGGYEFAVGALAILALGAAISPISPAHPVDEASYYIAKARSVAILTAQSLFEKGHLLVKTAQSSTGATVIHETISAVFDQPMILPALLHISPTDVTSPTKPALVIFTSGTTGPPKGGVLRHSAITDTSFAWAMRKNLQPTDTLLHLLPVHHATGIWVSFFPFILSGACIEFRSGSFDPAWTWDRWRRGGITYFSGVPTIYMRMMRYYFEMIVKKSPREQTEYTQASKGLKVCMCGTSALPKPIDDFWTKILGKRINQRYGSTELCVIFEMPVQGGENVPDGSVGYLIPGVDLKLVDDQGHAGNEGEVRAKSPHMFSKYLFDPTATTAAFDEQGYFKSGDIARKQGDCYFIIGRASVDILKSGGYKISALDVEREILALPYIGEVMVVGVPDEEFGQRVGVVLSLRRDEAAQRFYADHQRQPDMLNLDDLRTDLRSRLAGYKLPTLLRIIPGEIPKSATGKVVKKTLGPQYFPPDYLSVADVQVWRHNGKSGIKAKL